MSTTRSVESRTMTPSDMRSMRIVRATGTRSNKANRDIPKRTSAPIAAKPMVGRSKPGKGVIRVRYSISPIHGSATPARKTADCRT